MAAQEKKTGTDGPMMLNNYESRYGHVSRAGLVSQMFKAWGAAKIRRAGRQTLQDAKNFGQVVRYTKEEAEELAKAFQRIIDRR